MTVVVVCSLPEAKRNVGGSVTVIDSNNTLYKQVNRVNATFIRIIHMLYF